MGAEQIDIAGLRKLAAESEAMSPRPWIANTVNHWGVEAYGILDANTRDVVPPNEESLRDTDTGFAALADRDYTIAAANALPACLDLLGDQAAKLHDVNNAIHAAQGLLDEVLSLLSDIDHLVDIGGSTKESIRQLNEVRATARTWLDRCGK